MATHPSSPIPDAAVAHAIVTRTFGRPAVSVTRFPTGGHHYVFDCELPDGGMAVVRIARPQHRDDMVGAAFCSDLLRPLGVPLPRIMARDLDGAFPYLVLERLPGTDLGHVIGDLTSDDRVRIATDIVAIQRLVASLPSQCRYGFAAKAADAPHRSWTDVLFGSLDRSRRRIRAAGLMDERCVERVRVAVRSKRSLLDQVPATAFLHDATTRNVIIHEGRLSGIVDVDDLCFGDPLFAAALTWMSLLKSGGPADYVVAWLNSARRRPDWKFILYAAVFAVDFMSEYGQDFNGNIVEIRAGDRLLLEGILDRLLDAVSAERVLSLADVASSRL